MRPVNLIVIHCSATADGQSLARFSPGAGVVATAAETIDAWHAERGFFRAPEAIAAFNPQLKAIGYHYVVDADGTVETGRAVEEIGAHVRGFNSASIGVCLVGTDRFTLAQWRALATLISGSGAAVERELPLARRCGIPLRSPDRVWLAGGARVQVRNGICGHRDLSPDQDRNGIVESFEWLKTCPGFDVADWLRANCQSLAGHVFGESVEDFDA